MSSTRFNPPVPTLEELNADGTTRPDADGIVEFDGNDFAGSTNKRTLRSYISSLTRGETPTLVRSDQQGVIEYNGPIPDHGNAYPLGDESSPQYTFTETGVEGGGINVMQSYSDSGQFSVNDKTLKDIVNKGDLGKVDSLSHANGRDALSGHLLLQGVVGSANVDSPVTARTDGAEVLIDAIPKVLDSNIYGLPKQGASTLRQAGLVKVSRDNEILSSSPNSQSERVSVEELSKVAIDIMLKATGKPNGPDEYPVAGVIPTMVQEGLKRVDTEDLRARTYSGIAGLNSTVEGTGIELSTTDDVGETRYTDKSFGVTYNPLESFTGIGSSVTSYVALAGAATGVVLAVGSVIALATKPAVKPTYRNLTTSVKEDKHLVKGRFKFEPSPTAGGFLSSVTEVAQAAGISTDIFQILNIYTPTNRHADFGQCVILGFASLLGASYDDEDVIDDSLFVDGIKVLNKAGLYKILALIGIRSAAIAATGEKGYYMNLFREIVKDAGFIINNFDPASLLTPGEGISGLANAKIVRFINVLAQIGDMIVLQVDAKSQYKFNTEPESGDPYAKGSYFTPSKENAQAKTEVEFKQKYAQQRIRGSRMGAKRGSHLGVSDLPSAHLVPDNYVSLIPSAHQAKLTGFRPSKESAQLRLDQKDVALLERILDAEYMPFYFQDLRTNEIVAFHAFLEDLSDSYTANYNNAGGYGRVEEVKTYKDTKRSVGFSFNVIAMNEGDFDYMWWQINKLTTMVYPQWSRGRNLKVPFNSGTGEVQYDVTQPFSQIPTSTPVVRVRIGDVIRSNYSRFNLKRLFGLKDEEKNQSGAKKGSRTVTLGQRTVYVIPPGLYAEYDRINNAPYDDSSDGDPGGVQVVKPIENADLSEFDFMDGQLGKFYYAPYNEGEFATFIVVSENQIQEKVVDINRDVEYEAAAGSFIGSFYDAENNSIIRSFETTMGMGLAGVVTQLQFSWMDQATLWGAGDDGPGKRAPRMCKVQVSFDPIHDIAPGVDYEGLNRAPIYPVGDVVNNMVEAGENSPYGVGSTSYVINPLKKSLGSA